MLPGPARVCRGFGAVARRASRRAVVVGPAGPGRVSAHGEFDLNFTPSGTTGCTQTRTFSVGRVRVQVASLADVIRSKTAVGRRKDFDALPELHHLAGTSNTGNAPLRLGRPDLARAGHPDPIQPVAAQELAQARIYAARRQAAASMAAQQRPPIQR